MRDTFFNAYVECAVWASNDEEGDSLNGVDAMLTDSALERMEKDCDAFRRRAEKLWTRAGWDDSQAGHDFWLTRNHHGAGFWDRDMGTKAQRDKLTEVAHSFGECNLTVEDGKIYAE
jgi:hypothetical protein